MSKYVKIVKHFFQQHMTYMYCMSWFWSSFIKITAAGAAFYLMSSLRVGKNWLFTGQLYLFRQCKYEVPVLNLPHIPYVSSWGLVARLGVWQPIGSEELASASPILCLNDILLNLIVKIQQWFGTMQEPSSGISKPMCRYKWFKCLKSHPDHLHLPVKVSWVLYPTNWLSCSVQEKLANLSFSL